jgi:hypothetical protein
VIKFESMSIHYERDLSIVNCFDLNNPIIIHGDYLIRTQPPSGKFSFEIFKSGVKQQSPITRLEVFLLNKLVMPLAPLVLN